jgi:hypothetical protein
MTLHRVTLIALAMALMSEPMFGQEPDTLLVEVRLESGESVIVIAHGQLDGSEIRLPAMPLFELFGLGEPPVAEVTPEDLERMLGVEVVWVPNQLVVVVRDPQGVLPATHRRLDEARARSQLTSAIEPEQRRTGPFVALTADDRGEYLSEVGYSLGRVAGRVSRSSLSGVAWSLGASPMSRLWLSYRDGNRIDPSVNLRLALARSWFSFDYQKGQDDELALAGAVTLGRLVLYASTRDQAVVTWRGAVDLQVGHAGERSAVRVSYGPLDPSPLSIPGVR